MVAKSGRNGWTFSIRPGSGVRQVLLAGDFSNWKTVQMKRQQDGSFAASMQLVSGTYQYKFIVDGQWSVDPDNQTWALNPFGTVNSVVQV